LHFTTIAELVRTTSSVRRLVAALSGIRELPCAND
jgi:hypothetical protein